MILRCDTKNTSKEKEKNDKLHFIKIQNFCASKDPSFSFALHPVSLVHSVLFVEVLHPVLQTRAPSEKILFFFFLCLGGMFNAY